MIDRTHELPVNRQAELLNISRGSVYYLPRPVSVADLVLMRMIDELHLEHPRWRGHLCTAINPAAFHLSSPDSCSNGRDHLYHARVWPPDASGMSALPVASP